jgi:hypothetical protein
MSLWPCSPFLQNFKTFKFLNNLIFHQVHPMNMYFHRRCRNPSLGLATKARACNGTGQEWSPKITSHAPENVGECENEQSHSQMSSHFGNWNPGGLSNLHRTIAGVKTHHIEKLFISLEIYWNEDVWNGIAWPIWTLKTQVMPKKG